jgi:hypothetical protein
VALSVLFGPAPSGFRDVGAQSFGERAIMLGAGAKLAAVAVDLRLEPWRAHPLHMSVGRFPLPFA